MKIWDMSRGCKEHLPFVAKIAYTWAHLPVLTTNHLGGGSFFMNSNEELCAFFKIAIGKQLKRKRK